MCLRQCSSVDAFQPDFSVNYWYTEVTCTVLVYFITHFPQMEVFYHVHFYF